MAAAFKQSEVDICKLHRDLQKYVGSKEEKTMRSWMSSLLEGGKECFNLVLDYCNSALAVPFSNAGVMLRPYVAMKQSLVEKSALPCGAKPGVLFFDQLFDTKILKKISDNEIGLMELKSNEFLAQAVLLLLDFLYDIEKHETALNKVMSLSGLDESNLTAVLAEHLFSQLSPGHKYTVDDTSKNLAVKCPCGCKAEICKGCTSIGSSATWHGYVDIFLNQNVAVSVLVESTEELPDSEETCEEPPRKIFCKEDQEGLKEGHGSEKICEAPLRKRISKEGQKTERSRSNILFQFNTISQIVAEAITNGFAQVNMHKSLSGWLIPTFACTSDNAYVYLYDSVSDTLLQTCRPLNFMIPGGIINIAAVVKIWLYINFAVFCVHNVSQKCQMQKSNFHSMCASTNLKAYQKIECKKAIRSSETSIQGLIEPLILAAERIPDM